MSIRTSKSWTLDKKQSLEKKKLDFLLLQLMANNQATAEKPKKVKRELTTQT